LQQVLRAATEHKGTAFVEIYQNCNIFNDGAFEPLKDPAMRDEVTVRLEHGAPIVFGAERDKGLRRTATGGFEVVPADSPDLVVHDAHNADPSAAFALSRLDSPDFEHTPIGVFRQVARPTYDELMREQLDDAVARQGDGDLAALLGSGDTWRID
jgi:2-oxoglutarate ferredoxin oxidoreductase subunit beta